MQETYAAENKEKYEEFEELTVEEKHKRERSSQYRSDDEQVDQCTPCCSRIPMSHEDVARTDRLYLSEDILADEFITRTTYHGEYV